MVEVLDKKELYVTAFRGREAELSSTGPDWLGHLKREAIAHFEQIGFPGRRNEDWRFTQIRPIVDTEFAIAQPSAHGVTADAIAAFINEELFFRIVFVNGFYAPELSNLEGLPKGVKVLHLAEALKNEADLLEPHIARQGSYENHPFAALNTAFFQDGALIHLAKNTVVEKPIQVLYYSTAPSPTQVSHPRTLIVAGANSQAKVIESYGGPDGETYFTNSMTEAVIGENANVEHIRLQREGLKAYHISSMHIHLDRASQFATHSITLGGLVTRNDVIGSLQAEGIEATFNGLYLVDGFQFVDNHTLINHNKPHCNSHELYKGILDGNGAAVFRGKIYVAQDAQKTDSKQSNNVLLLSENAEINSMPQLEIYADDVKCTHGATTGQIDFDALFYLRSRGISTAEARGLLTYAFASDIIDRITIEPIRDELHNLLFTKLPIHSYGKETE